MKAHILDGLGAGIARVAGARRKGGLNGILARTALMLFASTLSYAHAYAQPQALEKSSIELVAVRDAQLGAQVAVADALGLFKKQGLDVKVNWTQSGADVITIMAGGSQYLATAGAFNQLVLTNQNVPVEIISALADMAGTQGIGLRPGLTLKSPKELEGKKFSYTQGTPHVLVLATLAKRFGVDMSKVTLVNLDPSEGVIATARGDVDGFLGPQPYLYRLTKMGGSIYATGKELDITDKPQPLSMENQLLYMHSVLLGRKDWVASNPHTTEAVLRALLEATDIINKDRPKAIDVIQKLLKLDTGAVEQMMGQNKYDLTLDASVATSITFLSDWGVNIKRLPRAVKPGEVVDPSFLKAVNPKLVDWKKL
jgi:ABC-type nitrate/sulfonate/bicarbonate transport system substrate-binding protein